MRLRSALVSLAVLGSAALVVAPAHATGPELLPNTSFEQAVNPVGAVNTPVQQVDQPLVPTGWAFEGAAGLFDHNSRTPHDGRYEATISDPASGGRRNCSAPQVTCVDLLPTNTAKDTADGKAYSVVPAWRPVSAVKVAAGGSYVISGWYRWELASPVSGGALVRVRWLDANGVGLGTSEAFRRAATDANSAILNGSFFSSTVRAPAGAAQAVPLFGAMDDAFISGISYDTVSFHAA